MKQEIVWHDYREEEPQESGSYLTVQVIGATATEDAEIFEIMNQAVSHYSLETGDFNAPGVIFWAELAYPSVVNKDSYFMDRDKNLNNPPEVFIGRNL